MAYTQVGNKVKDFVSLTILDAVESTGQSDVIKSTQELAAGVSSIRVQVAGTGAVSATVKLMGSTKNVIASGVELATFSLDGTTLDIAGTNIQIHWPYIWFDITAISGTSAAVTAEISVGDL